MQALSAYEEALKIRTKSAINNPAIYLPEASCTLSNLASFYAEALPDREKSIEYAMKTIVMLIPIYESVPFTRRYLQIAMRVLKKWGLTIDEINQLVEKRMVASESFQGNNAFYLITPKK